MRSQTLESVFTVLEVGDTLKNGAVRAFLGFDAPNRLYSLTTLDGGVNWIESFFHPANDGTLKTIHIAVPKSYPNTELVLNQMNLTRFTEEAFNHPQFWGFYLGTNDLQEIPDRTLDQPLQTLDFYANDVVGEAPRSFKNLAFENAAAPNKISRTGLRMGNAFTSIPPELWTMTGVTTLELTLLSIAEFPSEITNFKDLTGVELGFNSVLTAFPVVVATGLPNIKTIDYQRCPLVSEIPIEYSLIPTMESLSFRLCTGLTVATLDTFVNSLYDNRAIYTANPNPKSISFRQIGRRPTGTVGSIAEPPTTPQHRISLLQRDHNFTFDQSLT